MGCATRALRRVDYTDLLIPSYDGVTSRAVENLELSRNMRTVSFDDRRNIQLATSQRGTRKYPHAFMTEKSGDNE